MIPIPPPSWRRPQVSINLDGLPAPPFSISSLPAMDPLLQSGLGIMRLAWIGDGILLIAARLYAQKHYPRASTSNLNLLVSSLTRNDTLSYLALGYKLNTYFPSYVADPDQKRHADLFEAMLGVCLNRKGTEATLFWLEEIFSLGVFPDSDRIVEQGFVEASRIGVFLGEYPPSWVSLRNIDPSLHSQFPMGMIIDRPNNIKYRMQIYVMEESDTEESTSTKSDYSSSYVDSESGDTTFLEEEEDEEEIKLKLSPQDLVDAEVDLLRRWDLVTPGEKWTSESESVAAVTLQK